MLPIKGLEMYIQKTIFLIIFIFFSTLTLWATSYEDGSINKWKVSGKNGKAEIVYDNELGSSVVAFTNNKASYYLGDRKKSSTSWNNESEYLFSWKMNSSESYKIKIYLKTHQGKRYIYITDKEGKEFIKGKYLYLGLGKSSRNGEWNSFEFDLEQELQAFEPNNKIVAIHGIKIDALGRFDDIQLLASKGIVKPPIVEPKPEPPVEEKEDLKISNIVVKIVSENYRKIQWELNKKATGQVEYGETKNYGMLTKKENTFKHTLHRQSLRNLKLNTLYHYRVISEDKNGNKIVSDDRTFVVGKLLEPKPEPTPNLEKIKISNIVVKIISDNYRKIQWEVNKKSTGQVEYGESKNYGKLTKKENTFKHTLHRQSLRNLKLNTLYHYRVISEDKDGNKVVSDDATFVVGKLSPLKPTPTPTSKPQPIEKSELKISNIVVKTISNNYKKVQWEVDNNATGQVEYGETKSYGTFTKKEDTFRFRLHRQSLRNLKSNTRYHYRVISEDKNGNKAVSSDHTFTTEVIPVPEVTPLPSAYSKKYEDGQTNEKWSIIKVDPSGKKTPLGATVSSEFDKTLNSKVIVFRGRGKSNQYLTGAKADGALSWKEQRNFVLSWKMKISEEYRIRVFVETEKGSRIFDFTSSNNAVGSIFNEKYIGIGLGTKSKNGSWQEYKFDLAKEVQKLEPDNKLLAVHGFKVMGSARIDDIILRRGRRENPVEPPKVIPKQEPLPITENLDEQMMILNEYKSDDSKPWMEFIVTGHYIDFRDAKIIIFKDKKEVFSATLPELVQLGHLRQGTVVTISTEKTDMSYAPFSADGDDWILNVALSDLENKNGEFRLAQENVTIKILDKKGKLILPSSGSGMFKNVEKKGVVFQLHKDPSANIKPNDLSYYAEKRTHASFGIFNEWQDKEGNSFKQSFHDLRAGKDLNEVGGVVVSKIKALDKVMDAESIFYLRKNNTLWIADDDSHKAFEMEFTKQKLVSEFDDVKLGNFVEEISNYCIRKDSKGICDIESIAYDEKNDIFYILSGNSHSDSGIFKLTRKENEKKFKLDSFTDLGSKEFTDALFIDDDFIVVTDNGKNLKVYDYDSNKITSANSLFHSPDGKIYGMAYYAGTLWLTTSTYKLMKVDWKSKKVEAIYDMTENGVNDPRGIEVINNQLYILEGMNRIGDEDDVLAPLGHVLKNSIHIYTMP